MKFSEDPNMNLLLCSMLMGVVVNLVVPYLGTLVASDKQKDHHHKPEGLVDEAMTMLVHHARTPISSSIVVAIVIGAAVYLAQNYCM